MSKRHKKKRHQGFRTNNFDLTPSCMWVIVGIGLGWVDISPNKNKKNWHDVKPTCLDMKTKAIQAPTIRSLLAQKLIVVRQMKSGDSFVLTEQGFSIFKKKIDSLNIIGPPQEAIETYMPLIQKEMQTPSPEVGSFKWTIRCGAIQAALEAYHAGHKGIIDMARAINANYGVSIMTNVDPSYITNPNLYYERLEYARTKFDDLPPEYKKIAVRTARVILAHLSEPGTKTPSNDGQQLNADDSESQNARAEMQTAEILD